MPAIYTHDIFGKDVYRKLSPELKHIVKKNKRLYRIGLQGPDIFYFYRPYYKNRMNRLAQSIHDHSGACFFCQAVVKYMEREDEALLAYLLGFCCHYALDITCHPCIEKFKENSGFSHSEIEAEMDRKYMIREGKDPFTFRPGTFLKPTRNACQVISGAIGHITEKQVCKAINDMRKYTDFLVCGSKGKRQVLWKLLELAGCRKSVGGHIIPEIMDERYETLMEELDSLYEEGVDRAVRLLNNLYSCMREEGKLDPDFKKDFMGRESLGF